MFSDEILLKEIVDNSINGAVVTDINGIIKAYNKWCINKLGWKPDEEIGAVAAFCNLDSSCKELPIDFLEQCQEKPMEFFLKTADEECLPVQFAVRRTQSTSNVMLVCYLVDMSQHYLLEKKRKVFEEEVSILTSNIPGVVFQCGYEKERPFHFVDAAIEGLSGLSREELISGKAHYSQLVRPEDEDKIWHAIGLSLKNREPYTVEYRMQHQSGKTTWVSENGKVVLDEKGVPQSIVGVITDNTLTKTDNAEFESTINALDKATATIEFDLSGCVITANEHFLNLLGYDSVEEIEGHHHRLFCPPEFHTSPEYKKFWDGLRAGEFARGEYLRIGKQGQKCWIQATYNPILDADGNPYKIKKFATDLSDRKAMENDLRVAIDKAEAAVNARGYFMANMSHEIRTPMNSIIGFTELLLDSPLSKEQNHQLKIVYNASRSLLRLLNEILDMSKLEKGAVELEIADFNFMELCEQIIESLRVNAEKKGIKLLLNIDKSVPVFLRADSLRIQQILLNILSNAVKFTEKGSVSFDVCYEDGVLRSKIIDTGIGIDQGYLKRIFDPFTQAETSTTRRFGGSGLGTAIVRQLVDLMGGSIDVESELHVGTTFFIDLPIEKGEEQGEKKITYNKLPSMRILAVDDAPNNLELIKIVLLKAGHKVDLARDGEEAVEACKKQHYDVVLMDMQMPKMDGMEATKQIRIYEKKNKRPFVPVIAFSASVLEKDRQDALASGMQGFAGKPIDPNALFAEIERVVTEAKKAETSKVVVSSSLQQNSKDEEKEQPPKESEKRALSSGINWKAGLQLWGDEKTFVNSIESFLQDNAESIYNLQQMADSGNFERLAAQSHKICGVAGNLSLYRVHSLAKDAEMAAQNKDKGALATIIPALDKALEVVEKEVAEKQKKISQKKKVQPLLDKKRSAQAKKELNAAAISLKKNEIPKESLKKIAALLPQEKVAPLEKAVHEFNFKRALEHVYTLEKSL